MKSLAWISTVVVLPLALLAGVLVAVHAQADWSEVARTETAESAIAPNVLGLSPALAVTQAYTIYQPLAVKLHYGLIMYADDFSDPVSGWYVEDWGDVRWSYQTGEYEILIRSGPSWAAVTAPFPGVDDYAFEFDVRRLGGTDNLYGAIFGWVDWDHFYVFVVAPDDQSYAVYRASGDTWLPVVDWGSSPAIYTGNATNHLRLERSGSQLTVYANGSELASSTDDGYTGALNVGLYAEAGESVPLATRYDNVLITSLFSSRASAPELLNRSESTAGGRGMTGLLPTLPVESRSK